MREVTSLAYEPVDALAKRSRDELARTRARAVGVLGWLRGRQKEIGITARMDVALEGSGWVLGFAGFGIGTADGWINGLSALALLGLAVGVLGFVLAAWQTQRRIDRDVVAYEAKQAIDEEVQLTFALIDKIDLALVRLDNPAPGALPRER